VAGKPTAGRVHGTPRTWRRWDHIASLFTGPEDPSWDTDRDTIASDLSDPQDA
jgi:hypothetical protein